MAPLWFLASLALAELLYYKLPKASNFLWGGVWLLIFIFLFILLTPFYDRIEMLNIAWQYPITAALRILPSYIFFAGGVTLSQGYILVSRRGIMEKNLIGCLTAFVTLALNLIFNVNINLHLMTISNPLLFLLTGVLGSSSLIILSMIFSKDKILGILGRRSLDLMALHYPPIPIIKVASIICTLLIGKESVTVTFVFALLGLWALDICYEFVLKIIRQKG